MSSRLSYKQSASIGLSILVVSVMFALTACGGTQPNAASSNAATVQVLEQRQAEVQAPAIPIADRQTAVAAAGEFALQERLIQLYKQANPSVVYIIAAPLGTGSGFVYDTAGHIVTNNHVIEDANSLEVVFSSGDRSAARVVGSDLDGDLAVIKVDTLPAGVAPLPLAAPENVAVGQFVVAIGNPFGEQGSMSLGIVSGLGRSLTSQRAQSTGNSYTLPAVVQTDAPINPGNSGGPLLNLDGEVIGINAAIESETGANTGVGFSIPVAAIRQIVPGLIESGRYVYPYIGAAFDETVSLNEQKIYAVPQTSGAYVLGVNPDSPAERAGLVAANPNTGRGGDLIVAIDGLPVGDFEDLNRYLVFGTRAGQTIQITALRDGRTITLPLTLGERP